VNAEGYSTTYYDLCKSGILENGFGGYLVENSREKTVRKVEKKSDNYIDNFVDYHGNS
jgi:hypothetical protein